MLMFVTSVRGSIAALLPATDEKGISVEMDAAMPCPVYADSDRIVQVINNVVGNALKFSTGSGKYRSKGQPRRFERARDSNRR